MYTLTIFLLATICLNGQESSFTIYIQSNRYDSTFYQNEKYGEYQFMGKYFIDRDDKNIFDYNYIMQGLNRFYPNKYDHGFLSIDIENEIYKDLKTSHVNKKSIKSAELFVEMIDFIKAYRPNIKVGIYGLPFGFVKYKYNSRVNNHIILNKILEKVDYISPSLYLNYTLNEKNKLYFKEYIEGMLQYALEYGEMLSKPVYPYIWYRIDPYNKTYGGEIISDDLMSFYLSTIKNYRYNNKSVDGVIWWEPANYKSKNELHNGISINKLLYKFTNDL